MQLLERNLLWLRPLVGLEINDHNFVCIGAPDEVNQSTYNYSIRELQFDNFLHMLQALEFVALLP